MESKSPTQGQGQGPEDSFLMEEPRTIRKEQYARMMAAMEKHMKNVKGKATHASSTAAESTGSEAPKEVAAGGKAPK
ncbi:uncharacterized protein G2W53_012096 [Senna tora]|uniref:Uncharacterized protein n=1 Tax=Senna tora TaxID=362788 RepID=A0A834TWI0_9FABA|nr:uncharacterized protein G2W53_012096 [Senna tora]